VNFTWKDYRSTWSDMQVNHYGLRTDAAAALAGNKTKTFEDYYARIQMGKAQELARLAYSEAMRAGKGTFVPIPGGKASNPVCSRRILNRDCTGFEPRAHGEDFASEEISRAIGAELDLSYFSFQPTGGA
jgi:hypothetical protein